MDLKLPKQAFVNKFIPKNKFFSKTIINTKIKDNFTNDIQKITWKYKLSEETIGINKTTKVEEIQIFEIELKKQSIPKNVLQIIDKLIPYPILFKFTYDNNFVYGITLKDNPSKKYYFSEWNEEIIFDFIDTNLEKVYQNIIKKFIKEVDTANNDFNTIIETDKKISNLQLEIQSLKKNIKAEKQFNKKVELNKILQTKTSELEKIKN